MMLTILIGLPGSGKSTFCKDEKRRLPDAVIFDDFLGVPRPLDPGKGLFSMLEAIRDGRRVNANDVFLCREDYRGVFETLLRPFVTKDYRVRWIFYSNSPEECGANVRLRDGQKPDLKRLEDALKLIRDLTPRYVIPAAAEMIPVIRHG